MLLRGSAQRESRQRDELLETNKNKKREEKHLTLRQRRLLLLGNVFSFFNFAYQLSLCLFTCVVISAYIKFSVYKRALFNNKLYIEIEIKNGYKENEDDSEKSNSKESGESEKEAQELANHTLRNVL